jgi:hypothetical protein
MPKGTPINGKKQFVYCGRCFNIRVNGGYRVRVNSEELLSLAAIPLKERIYLPLGAD